MSDIKPRPEPRRMPHDPARYRDQISLTHFVNAYYQVRDCLAYKPSRVLVVGVGVGLEPVILRERLQLDVTTVDIDPGFHPDHVCSVHDLSQFRTGSFDVAIASHVLEHLPFDRFSRALGELARVARHALVYLPYAGRHLELRLIYAQRVRDWALRLTLPTMRRITGNDYILQGGEHCWECGHPGFSIRKVAQVLQEHFLIDSAYHNRDWKNSYNFCPTSRRNLAPASRSDIAS